MFEIMEMAIIVMIVGNVMVTILEAITKRKTFQNLLDELRRVVAAVAGATIGWFEFGRSDPSIQTSLFALVLLILGTTLMLFLFNQLYKALSEVKQNMY